MSEIKPYSFPDHKGRPGEVGGSLPRGDMGENLSKLGGTIHQNILNNEKKISGLPKELLLAFTPDGKQVLKVVGTKNSVGVDIEEGAKLPKNVIVTHNHPSGDSFSHDDLAFAAFHDVAQMRVVSGDNVFVIKRPSTGWPKKWAGLDGPLAVFKEMESAAPKLRGKYRKAIQAKTMTMKVARRSMLHDVLEAVTEKHGIKYARA